MIPERKSVYVPHDRDFTAEAVRYAVAAIEHANQKIVSGLESIGRGMQSTPRRLASEQNGNTVEFLLGYQDTVILKTLTPTLSLDGKVYQDLTDFWYISFSKNGEPISIEENGVPLNNPNKNEKLNDKLVGAFDTHAKPQRYINAYMTSRPSEFI